MELIHHITATNGLVWAQILNTDGDKGSLGYSGDCKREAHKQTHSYKMGTF